MELLEMFFNLPEIAQIALVIIGIIFVIRFIKFLFTNWFTSSILSLIPASAALATVVKLGEDITLAIAFPLAILCAASFCIWCGPSIFQVDYEEVSLGYDSHGREITFVRETGGFLVAIFFSTAISYVINGVLIDFANGMFAAALPVILIILNLRKLFRR